PDRVTASLRGGCRPGPLGGRVLGEPLECLRPRPGERFAFLLRQERLLMLQVLWLTGIRLAAGGHPLPPRFTLVQMYRSGDELQAPQPGGAGLRRASTTGGSEGPDR